MSNKVKPEEHPSIQRSKHKVLPDAETVDNKWGHELEEALEGLNLQQTRFVLEYVKQRHAVSAYIAAYGGQVTYMSAAVCGHRLLKNVKVRRAIRIVSESFFRECKSSPEFVLSELAKMAHVTMADFIRIEDDGTMATDLTMAGPDILGALEQIEIEDVVDTVVDEAGQKRKVKVGQRVKIKMVSRLSVLMNLAKIHKMFGDNFSPRAETSKIMKDLRGGEIDTLEAAYRFSELGLPLPDVIKIQLTNGLDGGGDDDDKTPITDEELDARYQEALASIQDQRTSFLQERQQQVLALKEELKAQDSFAKVAE